MQIDGFYLQTRKLQRFYKKNDNLGLILGTYDKHGKNTTSNTRKQWGSNLLKVMIWVLMKDCVIIL